MGKIVDKDIEKAKVLVESAFDKLFEANRILNNRNRDNLKTCAPEDREKFGKIDDEYFGPAPYSISPLFSDIVDLQVKLKRVIEVVGSNDVVKVVWGSVPEKDKGSTSTDPKNLFYSHLSKEDAEKYCIRCDRCGELVLKTLPMCMCGCSVEQSKKAMEESEKLEGYLEDVEDAEDVEDMEDDEDDFYDLEGYGEFEEEGSDEDLGILDKSINAHSIDFIRGMVNRYMSDIMNNIMLQYADLQAEKEKVLEEKEELNRKNAEFMAAKAKLGRKSNLNGRCLDYELLWYQADKKPSIAELARKMRLSRTTVYSDLARINREKGLADEEGLDEKDNGNDDE